jgi:twinfilin-like protein
MIFSSGVSSVLAAAKDLGAPIAKKIETSDPREINESFLRAELGLTGSGTEEKRPFAKPRGPARKQR